ncbi:RNA-directed DNA polymerase, eukaryota, reverse transcriptase zinc-binding domain protein [Tanacetum coccineum]
MPVQSYDLRSLNPNTVSIEDVELMIGDVSDVEVKEAPFDICDNKAPGPDGYTTKFYKKAWSVIGKEVCDAIKEFFKTGKLLGEVNATLITLVPKSKTLLSQIPGWISSRWSFLFFVLFVLLGVYFLTNLVLAVVYESFQCGVSMSFSFVKFPPGSNAIRLMEFCSNQQDRGFITMAQCMQLFQELKRYRAEVNDIKENYKVDRKRRSWSAVQHMAVVGV